MESSTNSVLIVGGGVIGLTSAFRLAQASVSVTVFDPSPGLGATWAAAGMVAPSAEIAPGEQESYSLQLRALPAWHELNDALFETVGRKVTIHETGTLVVGWDASDRRLVEQYAKLALEFGVASRLVTRSDAAAMFEGVSGRINDGLFIAGDAWLDPDEAIALISAANDALGVMVVRAMVRSVQAGADFVEASTDEATYRAMRGILATGAVPLPPGVTFSDANQIRPVRGMTVRVSGLDRSAQPTIRAFVHGQMFYMVSRPGGYCVLGATSEERHECVVELGDMQRLLRDALDIVPGLDSAEVIETRVGLRPASKDLRSFFEVVAGRWAWSSGHYRHGVTLAPLAARDALAFVGETG